jgi:hypothetical protein
MNDYFQGAVTQLIERGRHLLAIIPKGLSREFHLLEQTSRKRVGEELDKLRALLEDPQMRQPALQPERLRQFRRSVRDLDFLGNVCIAALQRADPPDVGLNKIIDRIRMEIGYPLLPPVVTPLSQTYFHIYPEYNLLRVPLVEGDFLLHLPDLYHELAHPLIAERYDPRVKPFQDRLARVLDDVFSYFKDQLQKEGRKQGRAPELYVFYLDKWLKGWYAGWAIELFCDLFAVMTLGPAFAWSHLHLHATRGLNPHFAPTIGGLVDHPADAARMTAILKGLRLIHFTQEADNIEQRWNQLLLLSNAKPDPEYHRCFPKSLLEHLAEETHKGVVAMGCRVVTPSTRDLVHSTLNDAWEEFWRDPDDFPSWEKIAIRMLREKC